MAIVKNIINHKFGKLLVIKQLEERGNKGQIKYECVCDCGNSHKVTGESLRSGKSKSCGCNRKTPPNKVQDREFAIWSYLYSSTVLKRNKKRGIVGDITLEDFIFLFNSLRNITCFFSNTTVMSYPLFCNTFTKFTNAFSIPPTSKEYAANNNFFI